MSSDHLNIISRCTGLDPQAAPAQSKFQLDPDSIERTPVYVRAFKQKTFSGEKQTALICNTIKDIFTDDTRQDDDALRLYLQALIHVVGSSIVRNSTVKQALEKAGFELHVDEIDPDDQAHLDDLYADEETVDCKALLGLSELSNPRVTMLAYCGAIILLAGKQLNDLSADNWTKRRVKGLSAAMGSTVDMGKIATFNSNTALKVYQKLSLVFPLKSSMVRMMFGLAKQGTLTGNLAGALLTLLSWSEMNHIKMVQEYIFERFPELLAMKQLQGSCLGVLRESWEFLNNLPEQDRPFAKLLYGPMQTKPLQRDRFVLLIDAAHAVGEYLHASFKNYQGNTEGSAGQAIKKAVTEYLTSLTNSGQSFAQAAMVATTNKELLSSIQTGEDLFNRCVAMEDQVANMVRS